MNMSIADRILSLVFFYVTVFEQISLLLGLSLYSIIFVKRVDIHMDGKSYINLRWINFYSTTLPHPKGLGGEKPWILLVEMHIVCD